MEVECRDSRSQSNASNRCACSVRSAHTAQDTESIEKIESNAPSTFHLWSIVDFSTVYMILSIILYTRGTATTLFQTKNRSACIPKQIKTPKRLLIIFSDFFFLLSFWSFSCIQYRILCILFAIRSLISFHRHRRMNTKITTYQIHFRLKCALRFYEIDRSDQIFV